MVHSLSKLGSRRWFEQDFGTVDKRGLPRATVAFGYHPREFGLGFRIRGYQSTRGFYFEFGFELLIFSVSIDTW